MNKISKSSK